MPQNMKAVLLLKLPITPPTALKEMFLHHSLFFQTQNRPENLTMLQCFPIMSFILPNQPFSSQRRVLTLQVQRLIFLLTEFSLSLLKALISAPLPRTVFSPQTELPERLPLIMFPAALFAAQQAFQLLFPTLFISPAMRFLSVLKKQPTLVLLQSIRAELLP